MDTTALVDLDIETGRRITETLDSSGIPIKASLWYYVPEASEWRLMVATPYVDQMGPQKTYSLIQKALSEIDLPLRKISAVSPSEPLIRLLRSAVKTGPGISGLRFSHNTVNNVYIEDAYVYRLV